MNFGNPQRPEIMGQFVGCIEGMAEACRALDFPIVSGNVSLYNETKNEDGTGQRHPADAGDRRRRAARGLARRAATIAFKAAGDVIVADRRRDAAISASRSGCASCTAARTGRRRRST